MNEFSIPAQNNASLARRLWIYQGERFPVFAHGLLVAAFSFSAISYSRICRGVEGFVSWERYFLGIFTTITLFLLVRIFDEFKDAEEDAKYRRELAVPRGLINFRELAILGAAVVIAQVAVNAVFFPRMLLLYVIVIAYLCLMGKEFFIPAWLKKHQFWYVTSHMFIIPLVDIYASGLDWVLEGAPAPKGLLFFFAVSYMNGIVLEIGRKIKVPGKEKEGVLTYTAMLGTNRAVVLWLFILLATLALAVGACAFAGYGMIAFFVLGLIFLLCALPALLFLRGKSEPAAKAIELASALWTITMYLTLGGVPMVMRMLGY
jgi:4-hydroxybenzoate polyprenyltransferase